ncbi:MAG TPA: ATP-dependent metallopeptidase FtsH/Yme1/Tma family protein [Candidatus Acidoferrales bacterium]|nr:ATP-dependent metallopeptidase FtsH/Yme1/Tma family protein [Candidatus Acidoferrales bacterium]
MTFAPHQPRRPALTPALRMSLFWLMMIALAAVLWLISSKSPNTPGATDMSYSDFMSQVEKNNIGSAKLLESRSTTQIQGQLRQPVQNFTATIPNQAVTDLLQRLRKQGATIDVREGMGANPASATSLLINIAPLLVIAVLALFMFSRMRNRRNPPQQGTPSNRPLG